MLRKIVALLLVMMLSCAALAESNDEFVLRDCITWQTAPEEALEAEPSLRKSTAADQLKNVSDYLIAYSVPVSTFTAQMELFFYDDLPFLIAYTPHETDQQNTFDKLKEALTLKYGEPTLTDGITISQTLNSLLPAVIEPKAIREYHGWMLGVDTRISLCWLSNTSFSVLYENLPLIFQRAEDIDDEANDDDKSLEEYQKKTLGL